MSAAINQIHHKILIVDDDIDFLMLLERRLAKEGYQIETAASLPEAEELIAFFDPELILLDVNVKGQDGRQLCWKLKHSPLFNAIKIIIISGYDCSATRAAIFGADDMIAKPLQTDYLLQRMEQALSPDTNDAIASFLKPFTDSLN
jgi:DNA-binding response OmpR family regulator